MSGILPREVQILLVRHRRLLRGLALAVAAVIVIGILKPGARQGRNVLVAAHDLQAGISLSAADLLSKTIPADLLPDGALTPGAAILGRTLTSAARRGEVLTDERILSPGLLAGTTGLVAAAVRITDSASVSLLRPGDRVDVLAAVSRDQKALVQHIIRNALVVAVPRPDPENSGSDGALVVLAVTADIATTLARAAVDASLSVTVVG